MPYTLTDDEQLIRKVVREFAQTGIGLEQAADLDRHDRFPAQVLQAAAGLGLTALTLPTDLGGAGAGPTAYALAIHELAKVCPNTAAVLAVHNGLGLRALLANPALAAELAPKAAAGELFAVLATEEAHGSDVGGIGTSAVPAPAADGKGGQGYRITGQKVWGIAASDAKHFIVLANVTGPTSVPGPGGTAGKGGPTLLYLPASAEGVSLGHNEPLMGLRGAGIRTVYLSNVAVPESHRVGEIGDGLQLLREARTWLQVGAAAAITGCVAGAFAAAAAFAATRIQFGSPIGTYQAVSDGVTLIDVNVEASLALTLAAAARLEGGNAAGVAGATGEGDAPLWAARAKAFANEMAVPMTRQAIRIQGGTGFMREGGTERFARDVRALWFVGETTQMQRDAIKRAVMPDIAFPATP
ncbi:MAG TPA: acyl-CoA dehydrogenase family protein [Candidatus Thermoplasmatota archaeon]|nr:acyl-CoA dehydrogenase family protein [Candidatus Thermoplasmatota archaeon]